MHVTAWSPCACENSNTDRPVSKSQTLTTWGEKMWVKGRRLGDWLRERVTWSKTCVLFWSFEWAWQAKYPLWSHRLKEILAAGLVYILRNLWGTFSAKRIFLGSFYLSGHQELSFADGKETDKLENRKKREIKTADGFPISFAILCYSREPFHHLQKRELMSRKLIRFNLRNFPRLWRRV